MLVFIPGLLGVTFLTRHGEAFSGRRPYRPTTGGLLLRTEGLLFACGGRADPRRQRSDRARSHPRRKTLRRSDRSAPVPDPARLLHAVPRRAPTDHVDAEPPWCRGRTAV